MHLMSSAKEFHIAMFRAHIVITYVLSIGLVVPLGLSIIIGFVTCFGLVIIYAIPHWVII